MASKYVEVFPAKALFDVFKIECTSIQNQRRCLEFPFNLKFKIIVDRSEEFQGPGIYWVTYEGNLIYIGSYSSEKPNIVHDRWVKHIQTFTNRGCRLGFGALTKKERIPPKLKVFYDRDGYRYCDTGTVTSPERLAFANENFDSFKAHNDTRLIKNFDFHYVRIDTPVVTKTVEACLIAEFNPICNSTRSKGNKCDNVVFDKLKELIDRHPLYRQ